MTPWLGAKQKFSSRMTDHPQGPAWWPVGVGAGWTLRSRPQGEEEPRFLGELRAEGRDAGMSVVVGPSECVL